MLSYWWPLRRRKVGGRFWWGSNPNGFVGKDGGEGDYKELEVRVWFGYKNRFEMAVGFLGGVH